MARARRASTEKRQTGDDATGTPRTRQIEDFPSITSIKCLSIIVITLSAEWRRIGRIDDFHGLTVRKRAGVCLYDRFAAVQARDNLGRRRPEGDADHSSSCRLGLRGQTHETHTV